MELTESYVKVDGNCENIEFLTIPEYLKQHAENNSDGTAFVFASVDEPWQRITWSELYQKSLAAAKGFMAYGLKSQEVVAINLRVCPEFLYAMYGTMMAGAIPFGISFTYVDGSDLVALMDRLKVCSFLITDPGLDGVNWNIARNQLDTYSPDGTAKSRSMPYLRCLFGVSTCQDEDWLNVKPFVDVLKQDVPDVILPVTNVQDIVGLLQTSGSTGIPKLIPYTHWMVAMTATTGYEGGPVDVTDIYFNERPFNWAGGYPFSVVTGQKRVTISGFGIPPENRWAFIIDVIKKEKCSTVLTLPPLTEALKRIQDTLPSDWPVKALLVGGQPLNTRIAEMVGKVCECLYCAYGLTECIILAVGKVTNCDEFVEYGCGQLIPFPGLEAKVVDNSGEIVPVNTRGEILARSPVMLKGYFNDEEKTKKAFTEDGWYKTDDLGRINNNGEIFVEGRKSNMIISGGFNVAPEIMEMAMKTFPGVLQVVIVPLPDAVLYQVLCACVLPQPDVDLTEDQLRQYCVNYHADKRGLFTVLPKYYMLLDKLPLLRTGKVDRKELERLAKQRFS